MEESGNIGAPRLGVSACLLGAAVRYDGGHKRNGFVVERLAQAFELHAFCPEVAAGLGVPRPPVHLVREGSRLRALGVENPRLDVTAALLAEGRRVPVALPPLDGFVVKRRSPSCALHDSPVVGGEAGAGLFVRGLREVLPNLAIEDEGGLEVALRRDHFIERVRVAFRWRCLQERESSAAALARFHEAHVWLIASHEPRAVDALRARLGDTDAYFEALMRVLAEPASELGHARAMARMLTEAGLPGSIREGLTDAYTQGGVSLARTLNRVAEVLEERGCCTPACRAYVEAHPLALSEDA